MAHVHFDIEEMRRRGAAALDAASTEALRLAETEDDRMFVLGQGVFAEAVTEFTVAGAELLNRGYNPDMVGAIVGLTLGNLFLQTTTSLQHRQKAMAEFAKWFAKAANGDEQHAIARMESYAPMPGSRA